MKRMRFRAALSILVVLVMAAAVFAGVSRTNVPKFTASTGGGSTGDSATAAADNGVAELLQPDIQNWFVCAACDSQAIYTTQVSPDGTYWFTIDCDTVGAGEAECTALFENGLYAGWYVRCILDPIPGAAPYGARWLHWNKSTP